MVIQVVRRRPEHPAFVTFAVTAMTLGLLDWDETQMSAVHGLRLKSEKLRPRDSIGSPGVALTSRSAPCLLRPRFSLLRLICRGMRERSRVIGSAARSLTSIHPVLWRDT
jgi:hypothetical protein